MKKSINYWSIGTGVSLEEACSLAVDAGYEAIELTVDENGPVLPKEKTSNLKKILKTVKDSGLEISSLATGMLWTNSLTSADAKVRAKGKSIIKGMLESASILETDAILVVPGAVDVFFLPEVPRVRYQDAWNRSQEIIGELVPVAEKCGVAMALENVWNKFLLSPLEMREFIDSFQSPFVGAYVDVGNMLPYGYPDDWILTLGPRVKRVHIKDFNTTIGNANGFCDLLEGSVNWTEVMAALKDIHYTSYLTVEVFPYAQHPSVRVYNSSAALDCIIRMRRGGRNKKIANGFKSLLAPDKKK